MADPLDPTSADAHNALGLSHMLAGRRTEAIASWERAVALDPTLAKAHNNLGSARMQVGDLASAVACFEEARRLNPDGHVVHANLGNALRALGRTSEAVASYERALARKPDYLPALTNLGSVLHGASDLAGAIACYRKAIALRPDAFAAHLNLGSALRDKGDLVEARAAFERALVLDPAAPEAHNNLGSVLHDLGEPDAAVASYERAIAITPDYYDAHTNLGSALQQLGRLTEAVAAYRRAITLRPEAAPAHTNLGGALKDLGRPVEAIASFREALRCDPALHGAHQNLLLTLHYAQAEPDAVLREHRAFAAIFADPLTARAPSLRTMTRAGRPLRVGYVSRDFRTHAVAAFIEPAITAHARSRCEVFCYADVARPDAVTERFRRAAGTFRTIIGATDDEVAAMVRRDAIDVLVDLGGHTAHSRLLVFARRPAPVQMTYLGYPDTTGIAAMDYRITDAAADPPGLTERFHTEALLRLPGGAWCFRAPSSSPDVNPLPAASAGRVTFGSFNNFAKITAETIAIWAEILLRVSQSKLLVKAAALGDVHVRDELRARFAALGIDRDRLDLAGWELDMRGHLATYGRVDIALDTFPYHGTTTTCEALWMGAPVVTLAGLPHVSRVGASLLERVGLADLVASSAGDYVDIAAQLAADRDALVTLRSELRGRMRASPLTDATRLARELEDAYLLAFDQFPSCARSRLA